MGWESRNYGRQDGAGRFGNAAWRLFQSAESPLGWSLPLYRAWGIQVRIHFVFMLMIAWELIAAAFRSVGDLQWTAIWTSGLFVLVLLHEYGHCIACRWVGGTADQILMWPLGGLASCAPPPRWKANLITTIGGPAVNAVLWPVLAGALCVFIPAGSRWGDFVFNPFSGGGILDSLLHLRLADGTRPWWLTAIWSLYLDNAALFLFNMIVVMYPMDAGRLVRDLLWSRVGYRRATLIVANVGLVVAVILFVVGLSTRNPILTALALMGGFICWIERKVQAASPDVHPAIAAYDFDRGYRGMPGADEDDKAQQKRARAEQKRREQEQEEQAELDRILAKIARTGMASLTHSEKRWLERATERRRRA